MPTFIIYCFSLMSINMLSSRTLVQSYISDNGCFNPQIDSAKVISSLYKGLKIIEEKTYSDFSYDVSYDMASKTVTVKSSKKIEENTIQYVINLRFKGAEFNKNSFSLSDDVSYEYIDSFFRINNDSILLDENLRNRATEKISPSLLWYGTEFGISAKHCKWKGKEIYLLRGLDIYCNGHHCNKYQLFAIERHGNGLKVVAFNLSAMYPYDFENMFLFDKNSDGQVEIFLPRNVLKIESASDFEMYSLF